MPLTEAEFDQATQDKYKAAMAAAAGTDPANVEILRVTLEYIYVKTSRRAGSIQVETKVRSKSECRAHASHSIAAAQPHEHAHTHTRTDPCGRRRG